jgi:hypothetical protein
MKVSASHINKTFFEALVVLNKINAKVLFID